MINSRNKDFCRFHLDVCVLASLFTLLCIFSSSRTGSSCSSSHSSSLSTQGQRHTWVFIIIFGQKGAEFPFSVSSVTSLTMLIETLSVRTRRTEVMMMTGFIHEEENCSYGWKQCQEIPLRGRSIENILTGSASTGKTDGEIKEKEMWEMLCVRGAWKFSGSNALCGAENHSSFFVWTFYLLCFLVSCKRQRHRTDDLNRDF